MSPGDFSKEKGPSFLKYVFLASKAKIKTQRLNRTTVNLNFETLWQPGLLFMSVSAVMGLAVKKVKGPPRSRIDI